MTRNEKAKAQPLEKSNFTRKCSLLSRYLKEKGSFGNIDLGLVRKPYSDLGLPENSDSLGKEITMHKADSETKSLGFLQRVSKGEPSPSSGGKANNDTNFSKSSEPQSSQLAIFFGGQVLVYNEFPTDKAREIMEAAQQAMPVTDVNIQTQLSENNKSKMVLPDLNEPTNSIDINQQQQQHNQIVERIARRASLHRFFAKRKDRAVARAPYQVNQNSDQRHYYPPKPKTTHGQPLESEQSSKREGDKHMSMDIEEEGQCSRDLQLRL